MKYVYGFFLVVAHTGIFAQEQDVQPQQMTASQIFSSHYARTYQAAIRYNDYNVAKHALYNMLVENPQNDSILYSLALIYVQGQQYASAVLSANDILTLKPGHTGALEIAAISYENLGIKDKALSNYESLYLNTEDYNTLYKMAFLQYDMSKYTEAKTNVDILLGKKETEELKSVYTLASNEQKEFPIKVSLITLKGMISAASGDKALAKKFYDEALALAPDFELAQKQIAELEK
ncbi:MAG: tetratricopeptide repeat protein [Fulvivirga sp.]